jgi:hypothetical protein
MACGPTADRFQSKYTVKTRAPTGAATGPGGGAGGGGGSSGAGGIPEQFRCTDDNNNTYLTAAELCTYINFMRQVYQYDSGCNPSTGTYWPIKFTIDAGVNSVAQAEAERVAAGGQPNGDNWADGGDQFWIGNISPQRQGEEFMSADLMYTARDLNPTSMACNLTKDWELARGFLIHYHPCMGPIATKMGCGAAVTADGTHVIRVIKLAP